MNPAVPPSAQEATPAEAKRRRLAVAEEIANAVLYEGHILYPYRPSSVKNRQRWTFGALFPEAYSVAQGGTEAWIMQTECLIEGSHRTTLDVRVRFLHLQDRGVGVLDAPLPDLPAEEPVFRRVPALRVGTKVVQAWQEAVEREVVIAGLRLEDLLTGTQRRPFMFPAGRALEPLREPVGPVVGVLERQQQQISGTVEVAAAPVEEGLFKLTVRIRNETALDAASMARRDEAVLWAFTSTHTLLSVEEGAFVSLLDPPDAWATAVAACQNVGTWPVLVGEEGERDMMLSSPIILYDYPQIAPESAGDLFDGTEIDEILTLRIMTLTDEEKQEVRESDERAGALLDRTEALPPELLMRMHGVMRNLHPLEEES